MSFFSSGKRPPDNDDSLNEILSTPTLRTELALLVALCSDAMRRDLLATFEPPELPNTKRFPSNNTTAADDLLTPDEESRKSIDSVHQEEAEEERKRQILDIHSAKTQGLKRAALTFFDKWQVSVLRRLGEVLSVRSETVKQARTKAKARADAASQSQRDRRYWRWANGEAPGLDESRADTSSGSCWSVSLDGFNLSVVNLQQDKRVTILSSVLLLLLSLEHYTAHSRVLMLRLTHTLRLPSSVLTSTESKVAHTLLKLAAQQATVDESTKKKADEDATERRWKVGLATVAGAALIGVTGGLAAPLLAAGVGSIMGGLGLGAIATLLGPLATSPLLVGGLFGFYGGKRSGRIMEKYAQEVRDFQFLPTKQTEGYATALETDPTKIADPNEQEKRKLRVAIGISGWLSDETDIVSPWSVLSSTKLEPLACRFEVDALTRLGQSLSSVIKNFAFDFAKYQLVTLLFAGLWPLGLLRMAGMVDQPFAVAKNRSDKAGKILADVLIQKCHGERPISLIGYSLGARVIYSALLELAEQSCFGLVENVVLLGAPIPSDPSQWRRMRTVVSGRVANVYSSDDYMLGFLYRASSAQMGIAGLQAIDGVSSVENYDFTDMIKGHTMYRHMVGNILARIGFEDVDFDAVKQQAEALQDIETHSTRRSGNPVAGEENDLAKETEGGQIILVDEEGQEKSRVSTSNESGLDESNKIPADKPEHGAGANISSLNSGDNFEERVTAIELEDEDNDTQRPPSKMTVLEPMSEPPETEIVQFGAAKGSGFALQWHD